MFKVILFIFNILDHKQKRFFKYLLFLSFFCMIFETLSIASVLPLISSLGNSGNNLIVEKLNFLISGTNPSSLPILFLLVFVVFTIKSFFLVYYTKVRTYFIEEIKVDHSNNLFFYYLKQPLNFHINTNSSQMIRNLNESQQLGHIIRLAVESILEIIMLGGLTIFLILLEPYLTLSCVIIMFLFGLIVHQLINKKALKWGQDRQRFAGLKLKELQQGFGAIRDIKILNKEFYFAKSFSEKNKKESDNNYKNTFFGALPKILFEWVAISATLSFILYIFLFDKKIVDYVPIMGAFALAAYRLLPSVVRIINANQAMKYWFPIVEPYAKKSLLNRKTLSSDEETLSQQFLTERKNNKLSLKFKKDISIENLSFKYAPNLNFILRNINLNIKENELVGIFGESGSGKTTLINLILGLHEPISGEIKIGDQNINSNIREWRNLLSFIPQNVYIIDDTIKNNIIFGDKREVDNDDRKIIESLTKAKAIDFVKNLKDGIETKCGEFGELLSGGQRQRLALARAFYNNSKILVFDEFTNFLDKENESKIMQEIKEMKDKTRIIVSHNLNVLKYCDKVFELKNSKLIEKSQ